MKCICINRFIKSALNVAKLPRHKERQTTTEKGCFMEPKKINKRRKRYNQQNIAGTTGRFMKNYDGLEFVKYFEVAQDCVCSFFEGAF
ncbi:hypothetical protein RB195_024261 [Necator americanus]|uniref:Uncharacterized protein n=1 Tax=Necator americanus TaxID=51031 RepID=A0ABR1ENA9_NECAM